MKGAQIWSCLSVYRLLSALGITDAPCAHAGSCCCRYISQGLATVVVHTLVNPGGELAAYPSSMNSSAPMSGPGPMSMGMAGMSMP